MDTRLPSNAKRSNATIRSKVRLQLLASLLCAGSLHNMPMAYADPTPGAEVVRLRQTSCGTDTDCFTDINALLDWTWNVRMHTATTPLLIDAGPGTFQITRGYCASGGNVTLRGSGRNNTTITATSNNGLGAINIDTCTNLSFQDLTINSGVNVFATVFWNGGGNSSWNNVTLASASYAWYDARNQGGCAPALAGKHDFFASTLVVNNSGVGSAVYRTECGDTSFWGSTLVQNFSQSTLPGTLLGIQASSAGGMVHLYGSNVKILSKASSVAQATTLIGLQTDGNGAVIHIHGGEVSVRSEGTATVSVVGANSVGTGSLVHGHQNNWGLLSSGGGTATRLAISSSGSAQAPFEWTPGTQPPGIISLDGQDRFVETDCPQTGGCQTVGTYPHTMIYRSSCATSGPWFDTVTNQCRGI